MSHRFVIGVIIAASLAIGGWGLAQQERPVAKVAGPAESGPFFVSPAGQSAVLLDTKSGKTWVLTSSAKGEQVWLPAKRIDLPEEVQEWQNREREIKEALAEQERREKNRAAKPAPENESKQTIPQGK